MQAHLEMLIGSVITVMCSATTSLVLVPAWFSKSQSHSMRAGIQPCQRCLLWARVVHSSAVPTGGSLIHFAIPAMHEVNFER
jgi:hypothetical protein